MSASIKELQTLHKLLTKSFTDRLNQDLAECLPTDAATLGAISKFLKDNAVTADPADSDDLDRLRSQLTEAASRRKERRSGILDDLQRGDDPLN